MEQILLLPVVVPILAGIVLLFKKEFQQRKALLVFVGSVLVICGGLAFYGIFAIENGVTLFYLTKTLPIYFKLDMLGKLPFYGLLPFCIPLNI